jgi:hypothetical protein
VLTREVEVTVKTPPAAFEEGGGGNSVESSTEARTLVEVRKEVVTLSRLLGAALEDGGGGVAELAADGVAVETMVVRRTVVTTLEKATSTSCVIVGEKVIHSTVSVVHDVGCVIFISLPRP